MKPSSYPANPPDRSSRLRILWVEDKIDGLLGFQSLGGAADELVEIVAVGDPQTAWELLTEPENADLVGDGFDAYLTDFRLTDKGGRDSDQGGTADGSLDDRGIFAEAAGFLIGLFVALRFPRRPSVVLPYSAYPEEFGDIWRLVKSFAPACVRIASANQISKADTQQSRAIQMASRDVRQTLLERAAARQLVIDTRDAVKALGAAAGALVPNDVRLSIFGAQFARGIYLGALFLDKKQTRAGVPAKDVREFLDAVPPLAQRHLDARNIASSYISAAESPLTKVLYAAVWDAFDQGKSLEPPQMPAARNWLGVHGDDGSSPDARRDAFLVLLVYLYARYILPIELMEALEQETDNLSVEDATDRLKRDHQLELFPIVQEGLDTLIAEMQLSPDDSLEFAIDELNRAGLSPATDRRVRLERLIQQYVDPGPESAQQIAARILAEARIGKGLQRLLQREDAAREGRRGNRLLSILEGRPCLDLEAIQVPLFYAREILPPQAPWPGWLAQSAGAEVTN